MAYIKPQSPLKLGEDHIYPLTTYDQILMPDGSRWNGKSGGLNADVIANNLTTTEEGYVLDARQGYELKELIKQKASIVNYSVVLLADGWVLESEDAPYTQTVSVEGVSYGDRIDADINMSEVTKDNAKEIQKNWFLVDRFTGSDGHATFYCYGDIPTIDLSVNVSFISNAISTEYTYAEEASF